MQLIKVNKILSIYQLIGFTLSFVFISIFSLKDSPMGIFIVFMMIPAFLPFLVVSIFCLFRRDENVRKIKTSIYISLVILTLYSIALPFFYEWGGFFIMLGCILICLIILFNKKDLEWQLVLFNSIGSLLLSSTIFAIIWAWLYWN